MERKKKLKILLFIALIIALFIIEKPSFAYTYNYAPITFNISAEYIAPFEVELENNGNWDLGEYLIGSNSLSKSFLIKVTAAPNTKVKITADGRTKWGKSLYRNGINDSNYLRLEWEIKNSDLTTDSKGLATTNILFDQLVEYGSPAGGNYIGDKVMTVNMDTF